MLFNQHPEIVSMSEMIFESVWALKFHQGNSHEFLHVVNGHFDLTLEDNRKFYASAGDSLIIPAGTMHRDVFDLSEDLEIFIIHFKWELLDKYTETVTFENINNVNNRLKSDLKRIFDQMRFDSGCGELDREIANARLLTALLLIYRGIIAESILGEIAQDAGSGKSRRKKLVKEAKRYIDKNFRDPLQLADIAEHLQVSPFYLSRLFARESDFSLVEYLTDIRINAAKELLLDGRYIIADVARLVGYHDGNYFSKVFKRIIGCSPTKYR
jgi:AraC-like DNA-binding protein